MPGIEVAGRGLINVAGELPKGPTGRVGFV
jgi:hypothetical protein